MVYAKKPQNSSNKKRSPKKNTRTSSVKFQQPDTNGRVKRLKKRPYNLEEFRPRKHSRDNMIKALENANGQAIYRENLFGSELIWEKVRYIFPNEAGMKSIKYLYIFSMVKRDALKYLSSHKIKQIKWAPSIIYNKRFRDPDGSIQLPDMIGTDIDSAYWNIAYRLGIISEKTFQKGMLIKNKQILVASLSSLGRDKQYMEVSDGKLTRNSVIIAGNPDLKMLYRKIRYTCFGYMKRLAKLMKKDFVAYKTDCIYYVASKKNVQIVRDFFDKNGIDYKMVTNYNQFTRFVQD